MPGMRGVAAKEVVRRADREGKSAASRNRMEGGRGWAGNLQWYCLGTHGAMPIRTQGFRVPEAGSGRKRLELRMSSYVEVWPQVNLSGVSGGQRVVF